MEPQLHDLEAALRNEMRLEAEEAEREAARSAAMRRTVREVAFELMAHGDTVAVGVGPHRFQGLLRHVGADYVSLDSPTSRIDIRLDAVLHVAVARAARVGGRTPSRDEAPAWRARLLELEMDGRDVAVAVVGTGEEWPGSVSVVGADHLCLADRGGGPTRFIPFTAVAYVRTGRDDAAGGGDD